MQFQENIEGDASLNEASFKVIKFGLAEWDREVPRETEDVYNAINLLSFESAAWSEHYIRFNENDFKIYLDKNIKNTDEFNEEATWHYDI